MNLVEILARTRNVLDELVEGESHWTDDRLTRFINEGLVDIAGKLPAPAIPGLWDFDEKHLSNGVSLYDLPSDWCKSVEIFLYGNKAWVLPIQFERALTTNSLYLPSTTYPYVLAPYKQGKVKIFPEPTELVTNGFQHHYLRIPVVISGDNDIPELPYHTHQWAVDYAVYRALFEDGDERATGQFNIYSGHFGGNK
ncbi:unnamed protein product [marine sediment metagenome]|uniref:Uncharacterized protein n=1 Tax=marine sediment metagenome TaxID=412755 RepID=X1C2M0_9ZZZZ